MRLGCRAWKAAVVLVSLLSVPIPTVGAQSNGGDPVFRYVAEASDTRLTIVGPTEAVVGVTVRYSGTLREEPNGDPITGAALEFYVGDGTSRRQLEASAITDGAGAWSREFIFSAGGTFDLTVRYEGRADVYHASEDTIRVIAKTRAIQVPSEVTVERGGTAVLRGRAIGDQGTPLAGQHVTLSAFGNTLPPTQADAGGNFTFLLPIPDQQPLGPASAVYTADGVNVPQTLIVTTRGSIGLTGPDRWPSDQSAQARVIVGDRTGNPLPGVSLAATLTGPGGAEKKLTIVTDPRGQATVPLDAFAGDGFYLLVVAPALDAYVTAEPVAHEIRFGRVIAQWTIPGEAHRAERLDVTVRVSMDGEPLEGLSGLLTIVSSAGATTDATGTARFQLTVPPSARVGQETAVVTFPEMSLRFERQLLIISDTSITTEAPATFGDSDILHVNATIVDDQNEPVPRGMRVELTMIGPSGRTALQADTDAQGTARFRINSTGREGGSLEIRTLFPGTPTYLSSEATHQIAYVAPPPPDEGGGFTLSTQAVKTVAVAGGATLGLAGIGIAGAFLWRKHRSRPRRARATMPPRAAAAAATTAPVPAGPPLELRFPDIDPDLPHVWGTGEPLRVHVRGPVQPCAGRAITLTGAGGQGRLTFNDSAAAAVELPPLPKGEHVLTAAPADWDGVAPAKATIRIVDYREEIAREFDDLLEHAHAIAPTLGKQATPREVEWTLADQLDDAAAPLLGEVALGMEIANWSHHKVTRDEYVRFVRAIQRLHPMLEPPEPEAPDQNEDAPHDGGNA